MDGDADQLEREVADRKAELAAEVGRLRERAAGIRRSAARRSALAAVLGGGHRGDARPARPVRSMFRRRTARVSVPRPEEPPREER